MTLWINDVLHNDGHYDNVFLTRTGKVTILDFGMAVYTKPLRGLSARIKAMAKTWPSPRASAMTLTPVEKLAVSKVLAGRRVKFSALMEITGLMNTEALVRFRNLVR